MLICILSNYSKKGICSLAYFVSSLSLQIKMCLWRGHTVNPCNLSTTTRLPFPFLKKFVLSVCGKQDDPHCRPRCHGFCEERCFFFCLGKTDHSSEAWLDGSDTSVSGSDSNLHLTFSQITVRKSYIELYSSARSLRIKVFQIWNFSLNYFTIG